MARFRVSGSFALQSRRLFVLAGELLEGEIAVGMKVDICLSSTLSVQAVIHAVEYIRHPEKEEIGICIKCEDDEELGFWQGLNIGDELVEVSS